MSYSAWFNDMLSGEFSLPLAGDIKRDKQKWIKVISQSQRLHGVTCTLIRGFESRSRHGSFYPFLSDTL